VSVQTGTCAMASDVDLVRSNALPEEHDLDLGPQCRKVRNAIPGLINRHYDFISSSIALN
jgi:hypothetical protein